MRDGAWVAFWQVLGRLPQGFAQTSRWHRERSVASVEDFRGVEDFESGADFGGIEDFVGVENFGRVENV